MANWSYKFIGIICGLLFMASLYGCGESPSTLTRISITPSPAMVGPLATKAFSAVAYDQTGKSMSAVFTWSASSGIGTIDAAGIFYAGSAEGSGTVTATSSGISGTSSVTVTSKGTISGTLKNSSQAAVSNIKVYVGATPTLYGISDTSGNYTINSVPAGTWEIRTSENALYVLTSKEVTVLTAEAATANLALISRFVISNEIISGSPITAVTGTVKNNGATDAIGVTVIYTFYDDTGLLVGTAQGIVPTITANSSQNFTAYALVPIDSYYSYTRTVAAQSY